MSAFGNLGGPGDSSLPDALEYERLSGAFGVSCARPAEGGCPDGRAGA